MSRTREPLASRLPDFPWDRLAPAKSRAAAHPAGLIDLSMGTPVDDVPQTAHTALRTAANSPGYPLTHGTEQFRTAVANWLGRACEVADYPQAAVLPTIGLKEAVALLPHLLGLGPGDSVVIPELAYPTYEVGATACGARVIRSDHVSDWADDSSVALVWLNSPSNPTGRVLTTQEQRLVIAAARRLGAVVASDECYLDLWWEGERPHSILATPVCDGVMDGLLALHSLSKRSNLAGYRVGSITGDQMLIAQLLEARKHLGLIVPAPTLAAAAAAYDDDEFTHRQRERYQERRSQLLPALARAGFTVDHSEASLFIWARASHDCWQSVDRLAERGILVAPGEFYGPAGRNHIRVALTASDDDIHEACRRLLA